MSEPLTRHKVPADNSCLFTACAYLCQGLTGDIELKVAGRVLRTVCAETVVADPDPDTRALMLGHDSVDAYHMWIRNEMHWGGEPEVLMLAEHFKAQLVVVSCESLTVLRYGTPTIGTGYLLYTGQHYDPLASGPIGSAPAGEGGSRCWQAGASEEELAAREKVAIGLAVTHNVEAAKRAAERRVTRLKCGGCGALLDDAAAFQAHCGEVEHDDDFTYDCEQVEVVIGADEALPESHVDLNAPTVHAFYNASSADALSLSMRSAAAPFALGGANYSNLEAYWRSDAVESAGLEARGTLLAAALRAQYLGEGGAALLAHLLETADKLIVNVDVDPWLGMQAAGGISTGQNMLGKALMELRAEAAAAQKA